MNIDKKLLISVGIILLFVLLAFNLNGITGSIVNTKNTQISLSSDGERFTNNPTGNDIVIQAGNYVYIKITPADNNKRAFIYDPRHSSKAGTFQTRCFETNINKCTSSIALYKTPKDLWFNGVYTVKIAGVSGKAEFTLQDSTYGG